MSFSRGTSSLHHIWHGILFCVCYFGFYQQWNLPLISVVQWIIRLLSHCSKLHQGSLASKLTPMLSSTPETKVWSASFFRLTFPAPQTKQTTLEYQISSRPTEPVVNVPQIFFQNSSLNLFFQSRLQHNIVHLQYIWKGNFRWWKQTDFPAAKRAEANSIQEEQLTVWI